MTDFMIDSFANLIPGFGSYRSEQKRRDDDVAARSYLVGRLQDCKRELQAIALQLLEAGNFQAIAQSEKLRSSMELAQSKIRAAVEGYSSWFESSKVDETKLKKVLELDNDLVAVVDRLQHEISQLSKDSFDTTSANEVVHHLKERFSRRAELLAK
jgi:anti-sigma-K factor RskA